MHCPTDSFESMVLDLGDCIGVESCVDLKTKVDIGGESSCTTFGVQKSHHQDDNGNGNGSGDQRLEKMDKQFPPPVPWLGRTDNFPAQMPWIMKRYYTEDGRLVIRGEKVKRHEYFQAHRSNGRLTLLLVPVDDGDGDNNGDGGNSECTVESEVGSGKTDGHDCERGDQTVAAESFMGSGEAVVVGGGRGSRGGGGGKVYQYCSMSRSSSCIFGGIAVAAVRSVHT